MAQAAAIHPRSQQQDYLRIPRLRPFFARRGVPSPLVRPLFRMPRWVVLLLIPILLLVAFLGVWAVDTAAHAGEIPRNITIGGDTVGGLGDDDLRSRVDGIASRYARTPVIVETPNGPIDLTAADLGVGVDIEATIASVHDRKSSVSAPLKPFDWFGSLFSTKAADIVLGFDPAIAATTLSGIDPIRTPPEEPVLDGSSGELTLIPGIEGQMLDIEAMIALVPAAVNSGTTPIEISARWMPAPPRFDETDYEPLIDEANKMVASGVRLQVNDYVTELPSDIAATW